jgi:uncharacterized protein (DUF433 family)
VDVSELRSLRDELDVEPARVPESTCMRASHRVEVNPKIMMGKPVIRGTRITVELILRKLSEGATEGDLLDAYPRLTRADIRAAVTFAADTIAHEETLTIDPIRRRARR